MKSTFERMGGAYQQEGDYLLPCVDPPESPNIGIWGERRCRYLQTNKRVLYTVMLLCDTLNEHLAEVDKSALEMFDRLVEQLKRRDDITEELKAANQMEWVQRMNAIRHEATEAVEKELIYDLTDEEKLEIASKRILKQYKPAFVELAKN